MKKALRLCCLLLGVMVVFTGCAQSQYGLNPKKPVTLELWHYYNGPQSLMFERLCSQFNETEGRERGILVEAYSRGSVQELMGQIIDTVNKKVGASELPDIFAAYTDTAYQVDKLGLVVPMDKYFTQEELAQYVPGYIDEGRFDKDGSLKIFPIAKSTEIFMLNKTDWDTFAAATGAQLTEIETMEGVVRLSEMYYNWTDSLTPEPNDGKAFFGRDAMANYIIVGLKQMGVELFSVKEGSVTLQMDKNAFRRLWDCYYISYINGWFTKHGKFSSDDAKTGEIIALVGSSSGAAYFPEQIMISDTESYPIELIVAPPPIFEGGEPVAVQQGAGLVITKSTEQKQYAAAQFLKWFTEAKRNIAFSSGSGYMPVKIEANDAALLRQSLESSTQEFSENLIRSIETSLKVVNSREMYTTKAFEGGDKARSLLDSSLESKAKADRKAVLNAIQQGQTPKEAMAPYLSEKNFTGWYNALSSDLQELCS